MNIVSEYKFTHNYADIENFYYICDSKWNRTVINVGIIGGETETAGELIRILINHPDVVLRSVCSPAYAGIRVDNYHRGLVGDTDLCFAPALDASKLNCVFLTGEPWQAREFMQQADSVSHLAQAEEDAEPEDLLHIIDLTGCYRDGSENMVYGFPEYRRKALVRGALRTSVPSPVALALELALFPLAKNHLLQGSVTAAVSLPTLPDRDEKAAAPGGNAGHYADDEAQSELSTRRDPIAPSEHRPDAEIVSAEAFTELRSVDPGISGALKVMLSRNPAMSRGLVVVAKVPTTVCAEEVRRLYAEAYSDHSFTFPVDDEVSVSDILNTNKCLINVARLDDGSDLALAYPGIKITAVLDNFVKGSAGNAVHCMNLLFGLSERTGLALKACTL